MAEHLLNLAVWVGFIGFFACMGVAAFRAVGRPKR